MAYIQEEISELIELSMDADHEAIAKLAICCEQSPDYKQQIRVQAQLAGLLDALLSDKEETLLNHVMQTVDKSTESSCEKTAVNISERIRALPARKRAPDSQRRKTLPYAITFLASAAALVFIMLNVFGSDVQTVAGPTIVAMDEALLRVNDVPVTGRSTLVVGSEVSVESGRAAIYMEDGSIVTIFGPTTLRFNNEEDKVCELVSGRISARVKPQLDGHEFVVTTAHAHIKVVGTIFDVRVEDDISFLSVNEGAVEFTNTKTQKRIICHAGESVDSGELQPAFVDKLPFVVATADTYAPNNVEDFQEQTVKDQLRVKFTHGRGKFTRHAYLRFSLPENIDQVSGVKLQLQVTTVDNGIADHVLELVDDNWSEDTLEWNNQSQVLSNEILACWTARERGIIEIPIDPKYLKGKNVISLRIRSLSHGSFVTYVSRESQGPGKVPPTLRFEW